MLTFKKNKKAVPYEADLEEIYDYICEHDNENKANYVLDQLIGVAETMASFPEKGSIPKELQELGVREYRQTFFKPYRLIYQVRNK